MKTKLSTLLSLAAVAVAGLTSGSGAFAQGTFTGAGTGSVCNPGSSGTSYDAVSCTVGSVGVSMQAWAYMGAANSTGSGFVQGRIGDFDSSGFGAYTGSNESGTGSNHAFDNMTTGCGTGSGANGGTVALSTTNSGCGGSIEGLLLNFGSNKVNLSSVGRGWQGADADMMVFAWTGGTGGPTMGTQAVQSNASGAGTLTGWTLVGAADVDVVGSPWSVGGSLYSSYFLITTYFGAANGVFEMGDDSFKINQFTAQTCSGTLTGGAGGNGGNGASCTVTPTGTGVPEPTSLALVSLALVGGAVVRRRVKRA